MLIAEDEPGAPVPRADGRGSGAGRRVWRLCDEDGMTRLIQPARVGHDRRTSESGPPERCQPAVSVEQR